MSLTDRLMGMAHNMLQLLFSQHMGWHNPMKWDVTYATPRLAKTQETRGRYEMGKSFCKWEGKLRLSRGGWK